MALVSLLLAATSYQTAGGVFFRHPIDESAWIEVDDAEGTCHVLQQSAEDRNGVVLADATRGRSVYLTNWGVLYNKAGGSWTVEGRGDWLDGRSGWKRYVRRAGATGVADYVIHKMAWRAADQSFVNDPRSGQDSFYDVASTAWYQVKDGACLAFSAVEQTYGAAGVQTIKVKVGGSLPLPAAPWILSTGFGTLDGVDVRGNWLAN